ncbi:hypothetical protein EON79_00055 [bacterium]|nr:MAG: hypothetical protein EON79_00055 [bacterium]
MLPILPPIQAPLQVELERGVLTSGIAYWDVTDTTLEEKSSDSALGGEGTLAVGPGRTLLIKFGGLDRIVGKRKVTRARIVFQQLSGTTTILQGAGRMLAPWSEGPGRSLAATMLAPAPTDTKGPKPPVWASTWRERHAGRASWQQAGARGSGDSEAISTAISTNVNSLVEIDGLAAAVQRMADRPLENAGFQFRFDTAADLGSSQAREGRPRLILELEETASITVESPDLSVEGIAKGDGRYIATVHNVGGEEAQFGGGWSVDGRPVGDPISGQKLAPGAKTTFEIVRPAAAKDADPKTTPLRFSVAAAGDVNPRNDAAEAYESGNFVKVSLSSDAAAKLGRDPAGWIQGQLRAFNDVYLTQSRFSFAPDGARSRVAVSGVSVGEPEAGAVRLEGSDIEADLIADSRPFFRRLLTALGLPEAPKPAVSTVTPLTSVDMHPGIRGFGDTRDESQVPPRLAIPYEPYPDRLTDQNPPLASGLLAATDVALLNGIAPALPKIVAVRVFDSLGRTVPEQEIELLTLDGATSLGKFKTQSTGSAIVTRPFLTSPWETALVRATAHGETSYAYAKGWTLYDTLARGNRDLAFLDLHIDLPSTQIEKGVDLAKDRIVSDSAGKPAADLAAITDGNRETSVQLGAKRGDWIEIDLGRDRTVAEIRLTGKLPKKYRAVGYGTGQRPDDASPLLIEADSAWALTNRGTDGWIPYRTPPARVRYVRLIVDVDGGGSLSEITVTPGKVGN